MTVVAFEDAISWPFELAEVNIDLDGESLLEHRSALGEHTKWAFEVPLEGLAAGTHELNVAVKARYASTRMDASEGCAVAWRRNHVFVTGSGPVGVHILAETDDVTSRFIDRLDVAVRLVGAQRVSRGDRNRPRRTLIAAHPACRDDGPLPFSDDDLDNLSNTGFGPTLIR